jgi:hypothetical protein
LTASVVALAGCSGAPDQSYLGRQALEHMSPVEKAALADKVVTLAELKQASQVFVDCVTRAGATVTPGEGSDPGYVGPSSYGLEWPSDADAVMEPKVDACRHEVNAVEDVWVLQHQASESDMEAAEQKFPGCARRAGLSVPGDTDWKDAVRQAVSVLEDSGYYGHASGSPAPQAPGAVDVTALGACVDDLTKKTTGALPGLAEALATLDPSAP